MKFEELKQGEIFVLDSAPAMPMIKLAGLSHYAASFSDGTVVPVSPSATVQTRLAYVLDENSDLIWRFAPADEPQDPKQTSLA